MQSQCRVAVVVNKKAASKRSSSRSAYYVNLPLQPGYSGMNKLKAVSRGLLSFCRAKFLRLEEETRSLNNTLG